MKWWLVLAAVVCVRALDNGLGLTPQMGWNSWNHFGCNINEDLIRQTIDALVDTGLASAGYKYVNLDDCWQSARDDNGTIIPDPTTFPNGIAPLADYAHQKGLLFGVYSDAGYYTCAGRPGSLGYETQDANTYAKWGVDYLKYDNCNSDGTSPKERYPVMRDALNATGREIFFSMCEWGEEQPARWGADVGNSWRTTGDITDSWMRVIEILDKNNLWADFAGPGAWNDPDMLEVGNGGMSFEEYKAHFALWSLSKAPLLIGCDITAMSDETFSILTATEILALNQDSLGVQGRRVAIDDLYQAEIYSAPLSGNRYGVILLNKALTQRTVTAQFTDIGLTSTTKCLARDLWARSDLGYYTGSISQKVPGHAAAVILLTPV
ncbi:alpha galactosidase [Pelomyxa schiedti]|nr:alpha galactosidase [Pelomyxa schiedti]